MPEPAETTTQPAAGETPATWENWIETQPDDVKALYQAHTTGLHNAVKATREERDAIRRQLEEVLPKAEKGSELERSLTENITRLEQAERRANFLESAVSPEIGCRNPRAAWAIANSENLFDRKGQPDWNAIKATAPELFGQAPAAAHAGNGTSNPPAKSGMNEYIRRAAGRS